MNPRRLILVALQAAVITTFTLFVPAAQAAGRSDHLGAGRASLRFCGDPGHCGGNMMVSVSPEEATAAGFARTWASDWNTWAAAHKVPQKIVTAGCNYLPTERYYLCAVRVRSHAASCGLLVVKPAAQSSPSDQIENGLETTCDILSAFPQQIVD